MKKFLAYLVTLVLVAGIGVGAYFLFRKPAEATSVMTMSVNPEVQFILDQNNKVMNVTAVNEDGTSLLTQVKFEGMKAEDAAKLFVEVSNQMGKVSLDASVSANKEVKIYISCSDDKKTSETIKNLQKNVVNSVNQYFKDNKIINGAKVYVEDMSKALEKFGSQIRDYTGTTFEEAMTYVKEVNKEFENIGYDAREGLQRVINGLKDSFELANDALIDSVNSAKKLVASAKATVEEYQKQLDEIQLEELKKPVQKLLDSAKEELSNAEKKLNEAQAKLQKELDKLQKEIDAKIKEVQQQCEEALKQLKETIKTQIEEGKKTIEQYKADFEKKSAEEKQSIINKIETFQNSLAKPIA